MLDGIARDNGADKADEITFDLKATLSLIEMNPLSGANVRPTTIQGARYNNLLRHDSYIVEYVHDEDGNVIVTGFMVHWHGGG